MIYYQKVSFNIQVKVVYVHLVHVHHFNLESYVYVMYLNVVLYVYICTIMLYCTHICIVLFQ